MIVIALGSMSGIKTQAAEIACRCAGLAAEVRPQNVASGVSVQPLGLEETELGARNRAKAARSAVPGSYGLGIESGVVKDGMRWDDIAAVCLIEPDGREWLVWSDVQPFPTEDVYDALRLKTTVGAQIAARTGCAPDDPHFFLTNQERSRIDFLADAVEALFRLVRLPKEKP